MRRIATTRRRRWTLLACLLLSVSGAVIAVALIRNRSRNAPPTAIPAGVPAAAAAATAPRQRPVAVAVAAALAVGVIVATFALAQRSPDPIATAESTIEPAAATATPAAMQQDPVLEIGRLLSRIATIAAIEHTPVQAEIAPVEGDVEPAATEETTDDHDEEAPAVAWWEESGAETQPEPVSDVPSRTADLGSYAAPADAGPVAVSGLSWPMVAPLTSIFGPAHPLGIDFGANEGTPVRAAGPGRVRAAAYNDGYGYFAVIEHPDGYTTVYAHFMQPAAVGAGQSVARGALVGLVGNTGRSTGPHLHFEVHRYNRLIDPLSALPRIPLVITPLALRGPETTSTTAAPAATVPTSVAAPVQEQASTPTPTGVATQPAPVRTAATAITTEAPPTAAATATPTGTPAVPTPAPSPRPTLPPVVTATVQPVATVIATVVATATATPRSSPVASAPPLPATVAPATPTPPAVTPPPAAADLPSSMPGLLPPPAAPIAPGGMPPEPAPAHVPTEFR